MFLDKNDEITKYDINIMFLSKKENISLLKYLYKNSGEDTKRYIMKLLMGTTIRRKRYEK